MTSLRSMLVGLATSSLLVAPAAVAEAWSTTSGSAAATSLAGSRYDTSVRFLDFDHVRAYRTATTIRGQVTALVGGTRGAVAGVPVKLYRRIAGTSSWSYLGTRTTSRTDHPRFVFVVGSPANATYQVVFQGTARLQRSRAATAVQVHRNFRAQIEDRTGNFHGRVTPRYAHRAITLEKRRCARCGWVGVRRATTGVRGRFHFDVGAPRSGRWWWRVSTPPTVSFIRSYSAVFTTRQR